VKQGIHPEYGVVAFRDRSTGRVFVTGSTLAGHTHSHIPGRQLETGDTSVPLVDVDVSSDSHPFWTGTTRTLDTEGRVERFERRYGRQA
jgi:large subunit ribosomal protein L31